MREPQMDPRIMEVLQQMLAEQDMRQQAGTQDPAQYFMQGRGRPSTGLYGTDQWAGMSPQQRDDYIWDFGAKGDPNSPEWAALERYEDQRLAAERSPNPNALQGGMVNPLGTQAGSPNFIPADMEDSIPKPEQTSGGAYWDFQGGQQNVNGPGWFQVDETYRPPNALTGGEVNPMRDPGRPMPGGRGFSRGGTPYPEWQRPDLGNIASGIGDFASKVGRGLDRGLGAVLGVQVPGTGSMAPTPEEEAATQGKLESYALAGNDMANTLMSPSARKTGRKKKGEYSDFFKALTAAKKGDKNVKKSFSELAKQLETEVAPEAKATGTPTI